MVKKKTGKKKNVPKHLAWMYPLEDFVFMKIETLFVSIITALIFLLVFFGLEQNWVLAIIFTIIFLGMYLIVSFILQKYMLTKEHYKITPTHLEIHRKSRRKSKKFKISLKDIEHHKLDKTFLGGYIVTKENKKHPLFFNTKQEIEAFEEAIKKVSKKR